MFGRLLLNILVMVFLHKHAYWLFVWSLLASDKTMHGPISDAGFDWLKFLLCQNKIPLFTMPEFHFTFSTSTIII